MKLNLKNVVLLLLFSQSVFAQSKKMKGSNGVWTFTQYASNIIKASFQPNEYVTNENVSDAVILKPSVQVSIPVNVKGNVAYVGKVKINEPVKKDAFNSFQIAMNNDEKVFGGGERALSLNRRGYKFNLYNNPWYGYVEGADNLNYSVPFFTTSDGYGLFFDNPSKGYVDIGKTDSSMFEAGFVSGELNVYIIFGNDYKTILSSYHKLTGTQPLPPRWAFGNLMSRFGYTSEHQVDSIVKMMRINSYVDAVIFDLFWFGDSIKGTMGNLAWVNKKKWPDPAKMISRFRSQNINTILITEPFVLQTSLNYDSAKRFFATDDSGKPFILADFYFGKGGLLDIFRNDTKQWFWSKYKQQMQIGVEGWWGDLGEPEKHPVGIYHDLHDLGFKRLFNADEVHNIYGHEWTKMLFEYYAREYPQKRLFSLNRSGFAGSQRYSIFPWTGDVSRSWSGLRAQLPVLLGMSMSGVPYVHSDAGGFAGGEGDVELYARWLQFAVFTPIFRPHGTALDDIDKNAFSFPSEFALIKRDSPLTTLWTEYAKAAIWLRYKLLPYNYTLGYKQSKYGDPLISPLYYNYPKDTTAIKIEDEFMWGENMLVAPILFKHEDERKIYFPEGNWYDFQDTTIIKGNNWINKELVYNYIPVYIKEGSFMPLWLDRKFAHSTADFENIDTSANDDLYIGYYPSGKKSKGMFYDDDGITKNGPSDIINFEGITIKNRIIIKITGNINKSFRNKQGRIINIGVPFYPKLAINTRPSSFKINGKTSTHADIYSTYFSEAGRPGLKYVQIKFKGEPVILELDNWY